MSRWRTERSSHPLAPFFRRRLAHLFRLMTKEERTFVRLLPVLLGGRFRRPGFDKEPPGLQHMPRRRRWGRSCEAIDFPPPLGFCTTRPLIRSILVVPRAGAWSIVLVAVGDRTPEEHRRLDERVQMLRLVMERRAPSLQVSVESGVDQERMFFAALAGGDVPFLGASEGVDPSRIVAHAPTPLARALALTAGTEAPFSRLLPGLGLACPNRFAAAASCDERLLDLVRQLEGEPGIVELSLASRVVRHAAHLRWKRLPPDKRRELAPEIERSVMASHLLPALRPRLDALLERHAAAEVKDGSVWRLELDGQTLLSAPTLDALRARALSESPRLGVAQPEWRRARALLENRTPRTLFVVEPGFLKHLVLTVGPTGRLRARRLSTEASLRLALSLRSSFKSIEISTRPGADPLLVSRLSQIASAELAPDTAFGVQRGERLLLALEGRIRDLPFARALGRPRRLSLLPERAEWVPALRPPRGLAGKLGLHVTLESPAPGVARALFVDGLGRVFLEAFPASALETWIVDTRRLLETCGASLSLGVSPSLAPMSGRLPGEPVAPIDLAVRVDVKGQLSITLGDEDFGAGQSLGWRALAETIFSHWPPRTRGRVRVTSVESARQDPDGVALDVLAVRSRVLRRLAIHLGVLARFLEAA